MTNEGTHPLNSRTTSSLRLKDSIPNSVPIEGKSKLRLKNLIIQEIPGE